VTELQRSPSPVEHARALIDLGAALRRSGRRRDAREPLRRGLDVAASHEAHALTRRARDELLAAGARRHAARFSWDRTVDALVAAYASATREMSAAAAAVALRPARERLLAPLPLRALPGVQVAR
jgi:hypothetical protein